MTRFFRSLPRLSTRHPMRAFLAMLLLVLILIVIGNQIRKPVIKEAVAPPPKPVETYLIGAVPMVRTQAKVEKSGVIDIIAQSPGIVSGINVKEGQQVAARTQLVWLASNYQGGNSASLARELAARQNKNVLDTYDATKELITKQKELADKSRDNAKELRDITDRSLDDTRSLLSLNEGILSTIDTNLTALEQNNTNGANDSLILSTKQLKSQYQSATTQLRSGLRQSEYQADENKPPEDIANLSRDVAVKQLEIQEKALDLSRDISGIQLRLAWVNEAMMYPATPFAGTVQRIYVRVGQSVSPGMVLATVAGGSKEVKIVAQVPADVARRVTSIQDTTLSLPHRTIHLRTPYIPTDTTDGALLPVVYALAEEDAQYVRDNSYVTIDIPVGLPDSDMTAKGATGSAGFNASTVFIPVDAVFQTQGSSSVYVMDGEVAENRIITLGQVVGSMVEVTSGLGTSDEVILTRTVLDGEKVIRSNTKRPEKELG